MLFRKLQNATQSFEVSVRHNKCSEALCQFSAGILHAVWCLTVRQNAKNDTRAVPRIMETEACVSQNLLKVIQNEILRRFEGFWGASRF